MSEDPKQLSFHERLREIMICYFENKQLALSEATGVSQPLIHRLLNPNPKNGIYPNPSIRTLNAISEALPEVNRDWLYFGKGEMLAKEYENGGLSSGEVFSDPAGYHLKGSIPLYQLTARGLLSDIQPEKPDSVGTCLFIPDLPKCDGALLLSDSVIGDGFSAGDVVFYRQIAVPARIINGKRYLMAVEGAEGEERLSIEYVFRSGDNRTVQAFLSKPDALRSIDVKHIRALLLIVGTVRYWG